MAGTVFPFLVPVLPLANSLLSSAGRSPFLIQDPDHHAWPQFTYNWGRVDLEPLSPGRWAHACGGLCAPLALAGCARSVGDPPLGRSPAEKRGFEQLPWGVPKSIWYYLPLILPSPGGTPFLPRHLTGRLHRGTKPGCPGRSQS